MIARRKEEFAHQAGGDGSRLLVERKLPPELFYRLTGRAADYLSACLQAFDTSDPAQLPNRTPNGKLEPKSEFLTAFNALEEATVTLVAALFPQGVHSVRYPLNCRVKSGGLGQEDLRPYATSKPHTDVWAGDPANTAVVIVPLLGDIERNGMRFGEPTLIPAVESFEQQYANYEEGMKTIRGVAWYDLKLRPQHAYLVDSWCIHHTLMRGGCRVSLDFRVSFGPPDPAPHSNLYIPWDDFCWTRLQEAESVNATMRKYA